jgi:hypothetical protein
LGGKDRSVDAKALTTTNGVAMKVLPSGPARCPQRVAALVYVAAFLPKGGQSLLDLTKLPEGADEQVLANVIVEGKPPVAVMPAAASRHALYGSCTKDVAAWAIARQCPQPVSPACGFSAPKRRVTDHASPGKHSRAVHVVIRHRAKQVIGPSEGSQDHIPHLNAEL